MTGSLGEVVGRDVPRETVERLNRYVDLLREENSRQNLVSAATLDAIWERHILDSAQLVRFESRPGASWLDIGSGAGLPGLVIALLVTGSVTLVEPRRLRAEFLNRLVETLDLANVSVQCANAEKVAGRFDLITARAVAPLPRLLKMSTHLSTRNSRWVLPKGRNAQSELAVARRSWHCEAEIASSCIDPNSGILLLRNVKARGER